MWGAPWGGVALRRASSRISVRRARRARRRIAGMADRTPRIGGMCGRFTDTKVDPGLVAARFGVAESAVPGETLGRFNICPTEDVLAITDAREPKRAALGADPAVGAQAARRPGADQRALGGREGEAAVRAAGRRRGPPLPGRRRRLVRVAAARAPQGRPDPVPLHGRRRRAVRVRRAVGFEPGRRRADRVGDDPHHAGERGLRCRSTTGCRACSRGRRRRRRGCRATSTRTPRSSCSPRSPTRAPRAAPANPAVNRAGVEGPELIVPPPPAEPAQLRLV